MPSTSESASAATAVPLSSGRSYAVAAGSLVGSIALCALGYLALTASGPWLSAPSTLRWDASSLKAVRGIARIGAGGLIVTAPDASHIVLIALDTSFMARDYPVVAWESRGIPDNVEATFIWYSDLSSARVHRRVLAVHAGRVAPLPIAQDPAWLGRIRGVALVLQGDFSEPILVPGFAAKPMSAREVLEDRLREWLSFRPWTGASINGLSNSPDPQFLPVPAVLAAIATLAGLMYAALWRMKGGAWGVAMGGGLGAIFLAIWIIADVRWQWNLVRQATTTWSLYDDKTWSARHRAAEDGPLFDFIERVRAKLPPPPARVFMAADLPYFRYRGAYHLYPYNVYYDPSSNAIPPPGVVHAGDFLVVYQRRGVQYDAAEKRLRWDAFAPVNAEMMLTDDGAALFELR